MQFGEYIRSIGNAANTILEGMAVTFSHLFREPITIQYPDRLEQPISEILPERYRGFLEVQMDICTGCMRCMRVCPIECIAIDLEKNAETKKKEMVRFDIDMGKCMYCGLCVDACKTESTGAVRHTKEFEAATDNFGTLTFRFIEPGDSVPLYKAPKDKRGQGQEGSGGEGQGRGRGEEGRGRSRRRRRRREGRRGAQGRGQEGR